MRIERQNFTAQRVITFKCAENKSQSFFWDAKTPGLGLRVTSTGAKSYIFETRLHSKTIRITIGDPASWALSKAQEEAARLKVMTDSGIDPRQVKAAQAMANKSAITAQKAQQARETVTVGMGWEEYVNAMKTTWGAAHLHDHVRSIQPGGEKRARTNKLTEPGTLAALAKIRLTDLTTERMIAWAKVEGARRPARARNARTLLSTFLNWCMVHPTYSAIVISNAAQSKEVKRYLGKPARKNDALQKEQLPAWFNAVKAIQNPVIAAYLQALLLTGARPGELICLKWEDIDHQWNSLTIRDKIEGLRIIPLTPYVAHLLNSLPHRNEWVFSSTTSASGRLIEPRISHDKACAIAGLNLTLHGLRRSFATLCEWTETPGGIAAQIQGHAPQGVREQNYIRRPLDLLRMWHVKIEQWLLEQAGIEFTPEQAGLHVVKSKQLHQ